MHRNAEIIVVAPTRKAGGSDAGYKPALLGCASRRWLLFYLWEWFLTSHSHRSITGRELTVSDFTEAPLPHKSLP